MHVVSPLRSENKDSAERSEKLESAGQKWRAVLWAKHDHRLWLETVWFLIVNGVTCYVFLFKGFEWPQEKGKVQRFMW